MGVMDPETERRLDQIHALTRDTHRMVRAIRRDQWIGFTIKVLFWIIILALPYFLYTRYLAPILSAVSSQGAGSSSASQFLPQLPSSAELQKLIHSLNAGQ